MDINKIVKAFATIHEELPEVRYQPEVAPRQFINQVRNEVDQLYAATDNELVLAAGRLENAAANLSLVLVENGDSVKAVFDVVARVVDTKSTSQFVRDVRMALGIQSSS